MFFAFGNNNRCFLDVCEERRSCWYWRVWLLIDFFKISLWRTYFEVLHKSESNIIYFKIFEYFSCVLNLAFREDSCYRDWCVHCEVMLIIHIAYCSSNLQYNHIWIHKMFQSSLKRWNLVIELLNIISWNYFLSGMRRSVGPFIQTDCLPHSLHFWLTFIVISSGLRMKKILGRFM